MVPCVCVSLGGGREGERDDVGNGGEVGRTACMLFIIHTLLSKTVSYS